MFQQYRYIENKYILIESSSREDIINQSILDGEYDLDKENPLSKEERLKLIFSDWQNEDILVISDFVLQYPKLSGDTLIEMTREEICKSGDLSILRDGEIWQDGVIIYKELPKDMLKPKWVYPEWVESATQDEIDLDIIKKQYDEYSPMDLPSVVEEMRLQDPELANEFLTMLIQLRGMANQISSGVKAMSLINSVIPQPSEKLVEFKNNFKKIGGIK